MFRPYASALWDEIFLRKYYFLFMINLSTVYNKKQSQVIGNVVNDIYLLPCWEIIKSFIIKRRSFLFFKKQINVNLLRKFSSENMPEKYSIRTKDGITLSNMNLMIYKDSVYIISLDVLSKSYIGGAVEILLQTAIEKAMYNTTEQDVIINVSSDYKYKSELKKLLVKNGFTQKDGQNEYEIKIFGEIYTIKVQNSQKWLEKISRSPILINK